jgi:hypothetical protein
MCFRRLNDRDVQRPWSAAAQACRDRDTGSAPANNQYLMMLSVSHGPASQASVDASLHLSGSTFNSAFSEKACYFLRCEMTLLALRVISLRRKIWSLSDNSGHR